MNPTADENLRGDRQAQPPESRAPTEEPRAPAAAVTVGGTGGVEGIVKEIRKELEDISARELELRRREQDALLEYRRMEQAARQAARAEVEEVRRQLAQKVAALNARAGELTTARGKLETLARQLRDRDAQLLQGQKELEQKAVRLRRRVESLRARFGSQRHTLRGRIAVVRAREQELEKRVQRARDDIVGQRETVQRAWAEVEARAARLATAEEELRQRGAELDHRSVELAERAADVQNRLARLAAEQTRLDQERTRLVQTGAELTAARQALREKEAELDRRWQSLRTRGHELARQGEELEARRRASQQAQTALEERTLRAEQQDEQLRGERTTLETEFQRLEQARVELAERQRAAEAACLRAEETGRAAEQLEAEAMALREQTEARENESRQSALAIEVERQDLERERGLLEQAGADLEAERERRDQELVAARAALELDAAQLQQARQALVAVPRRWWRRATGTAVVAALCAAAGWLLMHPPLYRATVDLQITSDMPTLITEGGGEWGQRVLAEHRHGLLDPRLLSDASGSAALSPAWRAALAQGRVAIDAERDLALGVQPAEDQRLRLRLSVIDADARHAEQLGRAAAEAYARQVNGVEPDSHLPQHYQDLEKWNEELGVALETARRAQADDQAALARLPRPEERERVAGEVERLDRALGEVAGQLDEQRASLASLVSAEPPPAGLDPAELEAALGRDTVFREDRQEYYAVVLRYRTELVVSMLLVTDPLKAMQAALAEFATSLAEQRGLGPPAELGATLETCAAEVERAQVHLTDFAEQWRNWVEQLQDLGITVDTVERLVVELVQRQADAADGARRLGDDVVRFVYENGARVEALSADGQGGTREVVVGAVLRGEQAAVKTAADALAAGGARVALAGNVELDAFDRQLRGLRTRLAERRELVTLRLQSEADRTAQERYATRVADARERVAQLEKQRETMISELAAALANVRELDEAVRRHEELAGRLRQDGDEVKRLETQRGTLDEKLADIRRHGPKPDRIAAGEPTVQRVSQARAGGALLAAVLTGLAAWIVSAAMIVRWPARA